MTEKCLYYSALVCWNSISLKLIAAYTCIFLIENNLNDVYMVKTKILASNKKINLIDVCMLLTKLYSSSCLELTKFKLCMYALNKYSCSCFELNKFKWCMYSLNKY